MELKEAINAAKKVYPILNGYIKVGDTYIFSCSDKKLNENEIDDSDIWIEIDKSGKSKSFYPFSNLSLFSKIVNDFQPLET